MLVSSMVDCCLNIGDWRRTGSYHLSESDGLTVFFSSRRRHTRFDCDWSSDVCSSDLSRLTVDRFKAANPELRSMGVTVCHPGLPVTDERSGRASSIALIVARMSACERYKGHDALLDAWPDVLASHPDAVLAIAGDGDDRPRLEE